MGGIGRHHRAWYLVIGLAPLEHLPMVGAHIYPPFLQEVQLLPASLPQQGIQDLVPPAFRQEGPIHLLRSDALWTTLPLDIVVSLLFQELLFHLFPLNLQHLSLHSDSDGFQP